jgi:hypothetical protein
MEETGRQKSPNKQYTSPNSNHTTTSNGNVKKTVGSFIGKTIKIKTASNEQIEGLIYTYDHITNCLVIDILFIDILMKLI